MDSIKLYVPKALPWLAVAAILTALYTGKLSYEQALALAVMLGLPSPAGQAIAAFSKKAEK